MLVRSLRCQTAPRRPLQKSFLQKIRLVDVLNRVFLFPNRSRYCFYANRPATKFLDNRAENNEVHLVEAGRINFYQGQRRLSDLSAHNRFIFDLGEVAHSAQ